MEINYEKLGTVMPPWEMEYLSGSRQTLVPPMEREEFKALGRTGRLSTSYTVPVKQRSQGPAFQYKLHPTSYESKFAETVFRDRRYDALIYNSPLSGVVPRMVGETAMNERFFTPSVGRAVAIPNQASTQQIFVRAPNPGETGTNYMTFSELAQNVAQL